MAQDRPDAKNLLSSVIDYLETLQPTLDDDARFKIRVSVHLLAIVARELELGPANDARELEALQALLDHEGDLGDLNRRLAEAIRSGALDKKWDRVFAQVLRTIEDKVRIVRPERLGD